MARAAQVGNMFTVFVFHSFTVLGLLYAKVEGSIYHADVAQQACVIVQQVCVAVDSIGQCVAGWGCGS